MLSSFPVLFLLLGVAMLVGCGLGFALNNRGDKWRRRFEQERLYYAQYRTETDAHNVRNLSRIAELEAHIAAAGGAPATTATDDAGATGVDLASIDRAVSRALENGVPDVPLSTLIETVDASAQTVKLRRTRRPEPTLDEPTPPAAAPIDHVDAPAVAEEAAPQDETAVETEAAVAAPTAIEEPAAAEQPAPVADQPAPADDPPVDTAPPPAPDASPASDDLTRIRGIDADLSEDLRALGVVHFGDIESMSAIDELALEQRLRLPAGYITAEQWRLQAALLAADGTRATGTRTRPR